MANSTYHVIKDQQLIDCRPNILANKSDEILFNLWSSGLFYEIVVDTAALLKRNKWTCIPYFMTDFHPRNDLLASCRRCTSCVSTPIHLKSTLRHRNRLPLKAFTMFLNQIYQLFTELGKFVFYGVAGLLNTSTICCIVSSILVSIF